MVLALTDWSNTTQWLILSWHISRSMCQKCCCYSSDYLRRTICKNKGLWFIERTGWAFAHHDACAPLSCTLTCTHPHAQRERERGRGSNREREMGERERAREQQRERERWETERERERERERGWLPFFYACVCTVPVRSEMKPEVAIAFCMFSRCKWQSNCTRNKLPSQLHWVSLCWTLQSVECKLGCPLITRNSSSKKNSTSRTCGSVVPRNKRALHVLSSSKSFAEKTIGSEQLSSVVLVFQITHWQKAI